MNPLTLECFGYGTGAFAPEKLSCCVTCPVQDDCWLALRARVIAADPDEAKYWTDRYALAEATGEHAGTIAGESLQTDRPDPWLADDLANIQRGLNDRVELAPPASLLSPGAASDIRRVVTMLRTAVRSDLPDVIVRPDFEALLDAITKDRSRARRLIVSLASVLGGTFDTIANSTGQDPDRFLDERLAEL